MVPSPQLVHYIKVLLVFYSNCQNIFFFLIFKVLNCIVKNKILSLQLEYVYFCKILLFCAVQWDILLVYKKQMYSIFIRNLLSTQTIYNTYNYTSVYPQILLHCRHRSNFHFLTQITLI